MTEARSSVTGIVTGVVLPDEKDHSSMASGISPATANPIPVHISAARDRCRWPSTSPVKKTTRMARDSQNISGARLVHQRAHAADRRFKADEDRFGDEEMADVEFADLWDRGDRFDIVEGEPVTGMDLQADGGAIGGGVLQPCQEALLLGALPVVVGAGVQLHHRRAAGTRGIDRA